MKTGTLRSEIRWLRRQSILNYKETLVFGIPLTRELQQSIRWNIVSGFSSCKSMSSADEEPMGLCCMSGCLTGCSLGILFIIVLPAGILLSLYSINNKDFGVLSAGIILILVPLISIPVVVIVHYNRRRLRKIRRFRKTKIDTETGANSGPVVENTNKYPVNDTVLTKTRF